MSGVDNSTLDQILQLNETAFHNYLNSKVNVVEIIDKVFDNQGHYDVDLDDLRLSHPDFPRKILEDPASFVEPFCQALRRVCVDNSKPLPDGMYPSIGFTGAFGRQHFTPRGLNASQIGRLCMVEGIVTRQTVLHPVLTRAIQYTKATQEVRIVTQGDRMAITRRARNLVTVPLRVKDENDNFIRQEIGLSDYKDTQKLTLQEVPERAPTGQLPCSVEVHLQRSLTDSCKPGDRVVIVGMYKALPNEDSGVISGLAKTVLVATNVRKMKQHLSQPKIESDEELAIQTLAQRSDAFEFLSRSFAPSIYGNDWVKKGLLLMLLGGHEKTLANGTHLRGDCHVMMIGDPSCGKSQLLRFVMNVAPLAISTTGRGTTGVGLTAAVTIDKDTNQRQLEAGAMVLADRGVVCIDEFDKMTAIDRVAIHEAMEQQTVTIAKAGIYAELHARCTVVAAANPKYGHIAVNESLRDQIDFPDSLLSRFDLIFVVRDFFDPAMDRKIARFVLNRNKSVASTAGADGRGEQISSMVANELTALIEVDDSELRKEARASDLERGNLFDKVDGKDVCRLHFLRKYIYYAKHVHGTPELSEEAGNAIAKIYATLRDKLQKQEKRTITTRALEGLIRLSTAHAKLKLHREVLVSDVMAAQELVLFCLQGTENNVSNEDDEDDDEDFSSSSEEEDSEDGDVQTRNAQDPTAYAGALPPKRRHTPLELTMSTEDEDADLASYSVGKRPKLQDLVAEERRATSADYFEVDFSEHSTAYEHIRSIALRAFENAEYIPMSELQDVVRSALQEALPNLTVDARHIEAAISALTDANVLLVDGDNV